MVVVPEQLRLEETLEWVGLEKLEVAAAAVVDMAVAEAVVEQTVLAPHILAAEELVETLKHYPCNYHQQMLLLLPWGTEERGELRERMELAGRHPLSDHI